MYYKGIGRLAGEQERKRERMIKCVFFDMDGVLVNTEPVHYEIWKQVFGEFGVTIDYEHYKGCIGSNHQYLYELIRQGYGVDFRERPEVLERFKELKDQYIMQKGLPEIPGAAEVVRSLKEKGYHMAIVSSSPLKYIKLVAERMGLLECFEQFFSGEGISHPKPAPDIYLNAAKAFGTEPAECVVLEDSENGSRAAKAAGMICYGFFNPDSGEQNLAAADQIFDRFDQFLEISRL